MYCNFTFHCDWSNWPNIALHSSYFMFNILQKQFLENLVKHSDKNVSNDLTYDAWLYPRGNLMVFEFGWCICKISFWVMLRFEFNSNLLNVLFQEEVTPNLDIVRQEALLKLKQIIGMVENGMYLWMRMITAFLTSTNAWQKHAFLTKTA